MWSRRGVWAATVFAVALLPTALLAQPKPMRDEDVVARVNGTPIFRKAVKDLVQGSLAMQEREPDPAAIAQLADDALQSLIGLELLYQESQTRGVHVSDAEVDAEIARSKQRFPDTASFKAALRANQMTEEDLRRDTRKTMAVNRLLEGTVLRDVKVTPEQVNAFYEQNKEEFKHPEEVRASHILIKVPEKASQAERKAAFQKADAILKRVRGGAEFATVARDSSQDAMTAARGGDRGFFGRGEMDESFEKAAFALTPGEVSEVVSTPYGYEIIKVTDRRAAGYRPLGEIESLIREVLTKSARQEKQTALVAELKKKAKVEMGAPVR